MYEIGFFIVVAFLLIKAGKAEDERNALRRELNRKNGVVL